MYLSLNNGCNDVINFCRTSKQLSGECLNIEEIRSLIKNNIDNSFEPI